MTKKTEEQTDEPTKVEVRRADRVNQVYKVIAQATASKTKRITTKDIANETNFSQKLVMSTINLINRTTTEYGASANKMLTYTPPKPIKGEPGGWSVASSWKDRSAWHATLHKHAETRVESLMAFADVMEGLWPEESQSRGQLAAFYKGARQMLDNARAVMTPRSVKTPPVKSKRKPKVTRVV